LQILDDTLYSQSSKPNIDEFGNAVIEMDTTLISYTELRQYIYMGEVPVL